MRSAASLELNTQKWMDRLDGLNWMDGSLGGVKYRTTYGANNRYMSLNIYLRERERNRNVS